MNVEWQERKIDGKQVEGLLKNVRLAFANLSSPAVYDNSAGTKAQYQVSCLIPADQFEAVQKALTGSVTRQLKSNKALQDKQIKEAHKTAMATDEPAALFRSGESFINGNGEIYDGFEGTFVLQAKTAAAENADGTYSPVVPFRIVDRQNRTIPLEEIDNLIYSGSYADVALTLKPYPPIAGNRAGVAKYLSGVRHSADGTRLGISDPFGSPTEDEESLKLNDSFFSFSDSEDYESRADYLDFIAGSAEEAQAGLRPKRTNSRKGI